MLMLYLFCYQSSSSSQRTNNNFETETAAVNHIPLSALNSSLMWVSLVSYIIFVNELQGHLIEASVFCPSNLWIDRECDTVQV